MSRLPVSLQEFRHLAARVTDLAAGYLEALPSRAAFPETSGEKTRQAFSPEAPEEGLGAAALDDIEEIMRHSRPTGPRFFGYVFGSGEPVAACGDFIASVLHQNVTSWRSAPAAVTIEQSVVRWIAEAIGCPGMVGSLSGGGSSANLMALAMAREAKAPANETGAEPGVVYASKEVHMSVGKAMSLLGLGRKQLRLVEVDELFRMRADALERAILQDISEGKKPIAIVASAGTSATGSIDPLDAIADVAERHHLWLHVDGAYGGFAAMAAPKKFAGLARADSIALDPHKWLYQPLCCGCLLYRDRTAAQRAFSHSGDYAKALSADPVEGFAFFEESIELSRGFRALRLWLSLRYHGMRAFRESIRRDLDLAAHLKRRIESESTLELLAPVELSAVCFRHRGRPGFGAEELDRFNQKVLSRIIERGGVYISNAGVRGAFALRACIVNHRATEADVDAVISEALGAAQTLLREEEAKESPLRRSQPPQRMRSSRPSSPAPIGGV